MGLKSVSFRALVVDLVLKQEHALEKSIVLELGPKENGKLTYIASELSEN